MKMYQHALTLYDYMSDHAEDGVYKGTKVNAWRATGASQGYYTRVFSILEEIGSIKPMDFGGRGRRVYIRLNTRPTLEEFSRASVKPTNLTPRANYSKLVRDVEAIKQQLPGVDLRSVIEDFETRLRKLELDNSEGE